MTMPESVDDSKLEKLVEERARFYFGADMRCARLVGTGRGRLLLAEPGWKPT